MDHLAATSGEARAADHRRGDDEEREGAPVDLSKLSTLTRIIAGTSVLALIALFLAWYGYSSTVFSASVSGFSTGYDWFGALLVIAAGAFLFTLRSGFNLAKLPVGPAVIILGASLAGTVLIALRWLTLLRASYRTGVYPGSYGPHIGIIAALIVGIVQVVGALRLLSGSGESVPLEVGRRRVHAFRLVVPSRVRAWRHIERR